MKTLTQIQKVEIILISSIFTFEIISGILCYPLGYRGFYPFFVTGLMLLYQILVRAITPRVLNLVHKKPYDSNNFWFRQKVIEKTLYKFFNVKKWKDKLVTYEPKAFSLKHNSIESVIETMCVAEVIHLNLILGALFFMLFGLVFGKLWIFISIGVLSVIWELRFIMAQRYNRPRVKALAIKRKN